MNIYTIASNGLLIKSGIVCGFIFDALGKGFYEATGLIKIDDNGLIREPMKAEVKAHNAELESQQLAAMKKAGKGTLYLTQDETGAFYVSTWSGLHKMRCLEVRKSWHNMAGKDGRKDVYFYYGEKRWHGVNVGDSQLCRVKAKKR